jgi:VanZ family protein
MKLSLKKKYFLLPLTLSLLVLITSLYPLPKLPEIGFIAIDKAGHFAAFFILVLSYLWAFIKSKRDGFAKINYLLFSFIICLILGGLIEILQHYLPIQRFGDWFDFYFDIAGVISGIILFIMLKRTKTILIIAATLMSPFIYSQSELSSKEFQDELNREYADPEDSPLDSLDLLHFISLEFFPIDESYIVEAKLIKQDSPEFFQMETSTSRRPEYRVWGYAYFTLNDEEHKLAIYQSKKLMNTLEYGDYLFLPFSDLSNGESTYYGGRYIDLRIPEGNRIIIDFNKAYNPLCAYSNRFSCPKVPSENTLKTNINAGVKKFH